MITPGVTPITNVRLDTADGVMTNHPDGRSAAVVPLPIYIS
jgi:hypothetical protein